DHNMDVICIFPSSKDMVDAEMALTLVYSGSKNRTMTISCVRRFHSCKGNKENFSNMDSFSQGKFPMVSHLCRGNPWPDGNLELAIMFLEKSFWGCKKLLDQFICGDSQRNLSRIDALAMTPLILRVSYLMGTLPFCCESYFPRVLFVCRIIILALKALTKSYFPYKIGCSNRTFLRTN
ncbi:hypothetical protein VP01_269g1, partial [Puccinia sorghi]